MLVIRSPRSDLQSQAVREADELLTTCVALRAELRRYEQAVRRARLRTSRGQAVEAVSDNPDFARVRARLTDRIAELEQRRRAWRSTMFRLQAQAGLSLAAIARQWGLSRQLVSRLIHGSEPDLPL